MLPQLGNIDEAEERTVLEFGFGAQGLGKSSAGDVPCRVAPRTASRLASGQGWGWSICVADGNELYAWGPVPTARDPPSDARPASASAPPHVSLVPVPGGCQQASAWRSTIVACNASGELFQASVDALTEAGEARDPSSPAVWRVEVVEFPLQSIALSQVAAGEGHCLALSETGEVWAWGSNDCGQVRGNVLREVSRPALVWGPAMMSAIEVEMGAQSDSGSEGRRASAGALGVRSATQPRMHARPLSTASSFRLPTKAASALSPLATTQSLVPSFRFHASPLETPASPRTLTTIPSSRLASGTDAENNPTPVLGPLGAVSGIAPAPQGAPGMGPVPAAAPGLLGSVPRGAGPNKQKSGISRFASVRGTAGHMGAAPALANGTAGGTQQQGWHAHSAQSVAAGSRHSCIVMRAGEVLLWGWNLYGQCGQDPMAKDRQTLYQPTKAAGFTGLGAKSVAAGAGHTAVLTGTGEVWTLGWNDNGQLGTGDTRSTFEPELVDHEDLEGVAVKVVQCGARHTALLMEDGNLYTFGWNKYGQCGLEMSEDNDSVLEPVCVDLGALLRRARGADEGRGDPVACRDVACGRWHTVALIG